MVNRQSFKDEQFKKRIENFLVKLLKFEKLYFLKIFFSKRVKRPDGMYGYRRPYYGGGYYGQGGSGYYGRGMYGIYCKIVFCYLTSLL